MGEETKIEWCDHTFNPWIGCTRVSPGCQNCYAERQNGFYKWNGGTWGPGAPRQVTSDANWAKLQQWNRKAAKDGVRRRVFCASLADVFDCEAPAGAREKLFTILEVCQNLEFLLLTKRPENWLAMLPGSWLLSWPANVRLGFTAENQEWFEKRLEHAVILRSRFIVPKVFVSYEPAIGELSIASPRARLNIDWLICGGESGPHARPMQPEWARLVRNQCQAAGISFFFKQWGDYRDFGCGMPGHPLYEAGLQLCSHGGDMLDGRTWQEFPK